MNPANIKKNFTILFFCAICLCLSSFAVNASFLTSPKSQAVCRKVTPFLETDLKNFNMNLGNPIFIRIFKESSELELWIKGEEEFTLYKTYKICSFSGELGPKQKEGDMQSPEGFYYVKGHQLNPYSSYHLSFNLGYPNAYDRLHGRTGSALMVHGRCVSAGCFAMTDPKIEEIYTLAEAALKNGQKFFRVHIFPFRMTAENMERHKHSKWISFWKNIKEGYDAFERDQIPPDTKVRGKRYVFEAQYKRTATSERSAANTYN